MLRLQSLEQGYLQGSIGVPVEFAPSKDTLFNLVLKVVNHCSLRCDYCYMERHNSSQTPLTMPLELVYRLLKDYWDNTLRNYSGGRLPALNVTWHGGEPLLAGLTFFREVVEIERRITGSLSSVVNYISTNGVHMTEAWAKFFKDHEFHVGLSVDGPKKLHDAHRIFPGGLGSFDRVMDGISILRQEGTPFGVMLVLTDANVHSAPQVFDFLLANNLKTITLIPYTSENSWLAVEKYADFSITFFDLWWEHDDPQFFVRDFAHIIASIFGRESNLCEYRNCFGNYLAVDPNGDFYMCDLLMGNPEFHIGNAWSSSLSTVLGGEKYGRLRELGRRNNAQCQCCDVFLICTGGCMYRRYLGERALPGKDIYCIARRRLIRHIFRRIEETERSEHSDAADYTRPHASRPSAYNG